MLTCSLCETSVYPIVSVQLIEGTDRHKLVCQGCVTAASIQESKPTVTVGRKKA